MDVITVFLIAIAISAGAYGVRKGSAGIGHMAHSAVQHLHKHPKKAAQPRVPIIKGGLD